MVSEIISASALLGIETRNSLIIERIRGGTADRCHTTFPYVLSAARPENIRELCRTWIGPTGTNWTGISKRRRQFLTGSRQILRQHPGFADGRHEAGVARPARQSMHVYVPGDAGAGGLPDIETEIQAVRTVNPP